MARLCTERFGRIDILINNAGVGMYAALAEMSLAQFQQLVATNWLGPVYAIQAVLPYMRRQGGGQIINISSIARQGRTSLDDSLLQQQICSQCPLRWLAYGAGTGTHPGNQRLSGTRQNIFCRKRFQGCRLQRL